MSGPNAGSEVTGPGSGVAARSVVPALFPTPVSYPAAGSARLFGPDAHDLDRHLARFGPRPTAVGPAGDQLLEVLDAIALSGRGGGHFPAATKWRTVRAAGGGGLVVANGAEGEPASAKDAALLQHRPHLVLDGLVCAAEAVAADRCVVWLHAAADATRHAVLRALAERRAAGLREPAIDVVTGPDGYLSGESSAVVRALSGGPALPAFSRVPAARTGVGGLPTLLHNVETLARVGLAARTGDDGYPDTGLVTVLADGRRTVLEVDPATTTTHDALRLARSVREPHLVAALHGVREPHAVAALHGVREPPAVAASRVASGQAPRPAGRRPERDGHPAQLPQAVLFGGYGGSWLPWSTAADVPLQRAALRALGADLGAGILAVLPAERCPLAEVAALATYLAASGAQQCGPCLFGLNDVAWLAGDLARGRLGRRGLARLQRFLGQIQGRGACHHPDGVVRMVRSALDAFGTEVQRHLRGRCGHPRSAAAFPLPPPPVGDLR